MKSKLAQRLITFFVVFPILIVIMFWGVWHHFPLVFLVLLASVWGAFEMAALLRSKDMQTNIYLPVAFGLIFPVLAYAQLSGWIHPAHTVAAAGIAIMFVFLRQIFVNTEEGFEPILGKVAGNLLTMIYPGFFLYFLILLFGFEHSSLLMVVFALATFGNDAMAWLWGTLFGKSSPKPFLVSPNKSVIGFIGGIVGTFLVLISVFFLFPGLLGKDIFAVLVLAAVLALTTILGDLFESCLKRSAGVKDSGSLIPGRGGILDSIDSLLFSAPIFYIFLMFIHGRL